MGCHFQTAGALVVKSLANALGKCPVVADTREMDGQLDLLTKNNEIVIFTSKAGLFRSSKGLKF